MISLKSLKIKIFKKIIIELLDIVTKETSISQIEKYGRNLLLFSCLYDNDNVFKFLATNFSKAFKADFKKCAILTYTNKNPNILKLSLEHMEEQSDIEKEEILKNFARNCFRSENIELTQEWLKNNLDNKQQELFISELFKNNNKPYLYHISKYSFWKELIKKENLPEAEDKQIFYNSLIAEPIQDNKPILVLDDIQTAMPTPTFDLPVNNKTKPELIVLKKKKRVVNLASV